MLIDEHLLLANGALRERYAPGEAIYSDGDRPYFYFQIISGTVELVNFHQDGKEFISDILVEGESLGESMLFSDRLYQVNAIAKTACSLLKLPKRDFMKLILESENFTVRLLESLSDNIFSKGSRLFSNSSIDPMAKICGLMDDLKENSESNSTCAFEIPLTRQQIANLIGLRVETVIRTVKMMEKNNLLELRGHQIYY